MRQQCRANDFTGVIRLGLRCQYPLSELIYWQLGLERPVYKAFWVKEASPETYIFSFGHVTNPNFCWPKVRPNTSPFAVTEIHLFLWDLELDLSDETLCFEFIWNCLKEDTRDSSLSFCHEIWEMSKFLTLHSGWTTQFRPFWRAFVVLKGLYPTVYHNLMLS